MGSGSLNHLVGERVEALAGVKMLGVPYSGVGPCINDVMGGQVDIAFLPIAGPFPGFVDKGSLKAPAVLGDSVHPRFPQVPPASATRGTVFGPMSLTQAQAAYLTDVKLFQAMARPAGIAKP